MFGLGIDAELPEFLVDILHEFRNAGRNRSEVMIAEFLALACRSTEQSSASQAQIRTFFKVLAVNQEVFLFQSYIRLAGTDVFFAKQVDNLGCCIAESLDGLQKRIFLIERFAIIGDEYSRNAEHAIFDESW